MHLSTQISFFCLSRFSPMYLTLSAQFHHCAKLCPFLYHVIFPCLCQQINYKMVYVSLQSSKQFEIHDMWFQFYFYALILLVFICLFCYFVYLFIYFSFVFCCYCYRIWSKMTMFKPVLLD